MSKQQVRIDSTPGDRPRFVKALRLIGNLSLKDASDLAIHLENFRHSVVVAGIEPEVAAHIADALRRAGAEVAVEDCSIKTPMLCRPDVNQKYEWHPFRLIRKTV
jgi:ribosomal protein L7/L12